MEAVAMLAALAFLVNKIVAVIRSIGKDNNLVATQFVVWLVGIAVLSLAAMAEVTERMVIPAVGVALGDLDFASLVVLGLMTGSTGSFAWDTLKAVDNTQSASVPRLLTGAKGSRRRKPSNDTS